MTGMLRTHTQAEGAQLLLTYSPSIHVTVGRVTRDYSKSPQAEVVIDVSP